MTITHTKNLATTLLAGLALNLGAASAAHAGFEGATVSADYRWPTLNTTLWAGGTAVVGADIEFPDIGGFGVGVSPMVDVFDGGFTLGYGSGFTLAAPDPAISFDGLVIGDALGALPAITGVSLSFTNIPGFSVAQLSFDADHVYVNQTGFSSFEPGAVIQVAVNFAPVPEPASVLLMGLGVLGLLASRRLGAQR